MPRSVSVCAAFSRASASLLRATRLTMLELWEARHETATLSSTVRPLMRCTAWNVRLIPWWKRSCGGRLVMSSPSSRTWPRDGGHAAADDVEQGGFPRAVRAAEAEEAARRGATA